MKPPNHLGTTGRKLWNNLHTSYEWNDPAELAILDVLCVSADRIAEARALIDRDGVVIPDRWGGVKSHPAHQIEKDNSNRLFAAYRALRLDAEAESVLPKFQGRPAGLRRAN